MEVGQERDYIHIATLSPTPALRWEAMRAIFTFSCFINCEGQSHKTMSANHNLFEEKGEPKRNRAEALLLTIPNATCGRKTS